MTPDEPMRGDFGIDHVPVPSGHAPRLKTHISNGYHGIMVKEKGTDRDDGTWIHCENPVKVQQ